MVVFETDTMTFRLHTDSYLFQTDTLNLGINIRDTKIIWNDCCKLKLNVVTKKFQALKALVNQIYHIWFCNQRARGRKIPKGYETLHSAVCVCVSGRTRPNTGNRNCLLGQLIISRSEISDRTRFRFPLRTGRTNGSTGETTNPN